MLLRQKTRGKKKQNRKHNNNKIQPKIKQLYKNNAIWNSKNENTFSHVTCMLRFFPLYFYNVTPWDKCLFLNYPYIYNLCFYAHL